MKSTPRYWLTWGTARGYSLSAQEESQLVQALARARRRVKPRSHKTLPDRQVMSLLLTLLRDGASLQDLHESAPNLSPRELAKIYRIVDSELQDARTAWEEMLSQPEHAETVSDAAARIAPHPVSILLDTPVPDRAERAEWVRRKVLETTDRINRYEQQMHTTDAQSERYNLHYSLARADSCLWDDLYFIPKRVGQLTPARLSFVLGELA